MSPRNRPTRSSRAAGLGRCHTPLRRWRNSPRTPSKRLPQPSRRTSPQPLRGSLRTCVSPFLVTTPGARPAARHLTPPGSDLVREPRGQCGASVRVWLESGEPTVQPPSGADGSRNRDCCQAWRPRSSPWRSRDPARRQGSSTAQVGRLVRPYRDHGLVAFPAAALATAERADVGRSFAVHLVPGRVEEQFLRRVFSPAKRVFRPVR